MTPEFWHERWERNEIGFHQDIVNTHLRNFWPALEVPPGSTVFVPLCGKSRDMLWLAAEGYRVLGVEVSPIAVQALFDENRLRAEITPHAPLQSWKQDELEVLLGDFFDLSPRHLEGVGAVYDRASLVALPPDMRSRYAAHLKRLLAKDTPVLLVTLEYPQREMGGPPFSVSEQEVLELYGDCCDITPLNRVDALAENPHLKARGLTRLVETAYRLRLGN